MELKEAVEKAHRILNEEISTPTVEYFDPVLEWIIATQKPGASGVPYTREIAKASAAREKNGSKLNLHTDPNNRPRAVRESPDEYVFRSVNYDMLRSLFNQVSAPDRAEFIKAILGRVSREFGWRPIKEKQFPSYDYKVSELPLIAEFTVRSGYTEELLAAVSKVPAPTNGKQLCSYNLRR